MRVWIDRRSDVRNLALKEAARIGQHMHFERQADMHQWRIDLADIGDQIHGRKVANGVDRVRGACGLTIDVLADPDLALSDRAADWRAHGRHWVELLRRLGLERGD